MGRLESFRQRRFERKNLPNQEADASTMLALVDEALVFLPDPADTHMGLGVKDIDKSAAVLHLAGFKIARIGNNEEAANTHLAEAIQLEPELVEDFQKLPSDAQLGYLFQNLVPARDDTRLLGFIVRQVKDPKRSTLYNNALNLARREIESPAMRDIPMVKLQ